ncbi:lamin tail domain-containing protein [Ferruginibacter yonginensis]|uniref:Lamin tail domain-containing protein n=1 Tax=Ferruginibacter yonginensis TaxID=1310416 RepID=A0ABV8QRU1_9BACT
MKKIVLASYFITTTFFASKAQLIDNFADGNFTANPTWVGGTADFTVNAAFQLQSNNTVVNSGYYLSTASTLAATAQWDFYCNLTFNPSGANFVDVFLTASASDLTLNSTTGYFVRIGNTLDEICLYKKDATGVVTKIIDGVDAVLNTSNNVMKIRVVRNSANLWTLSRDLTGTGNSYVTEGTVTDNTYNTSAFFGILIRQSTASFFQRHFFDDIQVQTFVPDVTPPSITTVTALTANTVDVLFNEPVDVTTAQLASNYIVSNAVGTPTTAVRDAVNTALVHLTFANNLPIRTNLTLTINGVADVAGNILNNGTRTFLYFVPLQYDVVIDEIMADPTPVVSLPTNEWLELRNNTTFPINLQNWRLGKSTGESGAMPNYILPPGGFVIVCTGSAVAAMSVYGPTIAVTSFPSLNNDADRIYVKAPQGLIVHSVGYTDAWYKNELKKDGGWTLEMIDTKNPCTGINNWKASTDARGGTPGTINSADAVNPDNANPKLVRAYAPNANNIVLVFDEPLDSTKAAVAASYTISNGIGVPTTATPLSIAFDRVQLTFSTALAANTVYTVTATAVTDCSGNAIGVNNTAKVGFPVRMDSTDMVVNEILFNPTPTGVDYVEFYNRSKKILNLKNAYIANRNTSGIIASITQFSTEDYLLFPDEYIVVTSDPTIVKQQFVANNPTAFIQISTPSFNDDKSNVILLNEQGLIVDEVAYSDKWHFALISNTEGVSLERIDPNAASVQANFHSAASSVGYGTPTYKNSQYKIDAEVKGDITITPAIVSPDNDGFDDFATIQYSFPEPGYVANITIFDAAGRPVRYLQRNALNGLKGSYRWDGLGEKNQVLPVGIYIIYTEVFNLQGKTKKFKNTIVVARRN